MKLIVTWLVFVIWLLPAAAGADKPPAKGKLLVATELVRGEVFAETVILLLHYDENGALGIVVNRPTDVAPNEVVADVDVFSGYGGTLYWGGPVQMNSLHALLRTDTPPKDAEAIVDSVHLVRINDGLKNAAADLTNLRFFMGYAGWGAGQLDREMDRGSWHVMPASDEHVFAEDPRALWKRLTPPREHRAAARSSHTLGIVGNGKSPVFSPYVSNSDDSHRVGISRRLRPDRAVARHPGTRRIYRGRYPGR